jgi:hypothetical protein
LELELMLMFKIANVLLCPLTLVKNRIHGLNRLKDETIRVINELVDEPLYDTKDYKVRTGIFDGFSFYHKRTGHVLASACRIKDRYVGIKNPDIKSKFFPNDFAQEHSGIFKVSEDLYFWHDKNKACSIISEINVDPIVSKKIYGIGAEHPYHNTIKIKLDDQIDIISIVKEVYDLSEMYCSTIESKELPPDQPLEEIFNISNGFINEKAKPGL